MRWMAPCMIDWWPGLSFCVSETDHMICVVIAMQKQPLFPVEQGRPHPSDQVLDRAMLALRMQRPEEAEQLAAGVLKASRGNVRAAVIHGQALMAQGRAEDAVVSLEKSARRTDDPTAATVLASALAAAGRQRSVSRLRQVTTRRPPFPPAFREFPAARPSWTDKRGSRNA